MVHGEIYIKGQGHGPLLMSGWPGITKFGSSKGIQRSIFKVDIDYFMVGECVRFLFTSCEANE